MADVLSLAQYKAYKGITDNTNDAQYTALIDAVNDYVPKYCNREFGIGEYTERKDGVTTHEGRYFFTVDNSPIISVQAVALNFFGVDNPILTLDVSRLDVFNKPGYAYYSYTLNDTVNLIRPIYLQSRFYYDITYSGGENVPGSVSLAATMIISDTFDYMSNSTPASGSTVVNGKLKRYEIGDYSETYENTSAGKLHESSSNGLVLTKTVMDLLQPYRRSGQSS